MEFRFNGRLNAFECSMFTSGAQVLFGEFNATTAGYGIQLTPSRTWAMRGNADDGGVVISGTGAAYLFSSRRLLLTAAQTGNNSYFGGCDRLSVNADVSGVTAEMAGGWSMLEIKASGKTNSLSAAHRFDLNIASGSVVSAGVTSALLVAAEKISPSTTTGTVAVMHVPNPQAGTYGAFAVFGDTTGCTTAGGTHESITAAGFLTVIVGSTTYYVPLLSA